ncbi:thioesterase II family protein [Peribacillus frigoritolerans]|uniref:thioesterase II family protein n=1 Tax=Peribacillus frigoritolerans TaxID=450367 RepID=UPI002EA97397|nr:thioesterase domain-containing protein [Peribacillus frigoritolerans]
MYRLFCFPYAGGSSSFYRPWASYCNEDIEVIGIQLPGRDKRIYETPIDNLENLISNLTMEIKEFLDKPFVFFGHSMGSILSYEICKALLLSENHIPKHLFLSSCRAPHLSLREEMIHTLSDSLFIEKLKELNGTPDEILNRKEFSELFLPMLRSDFKIAETYQRSIDTQLPLPITCIIGDNDTVSVSDSMEWQKHTSDIFSHSIYSGDHFYLKSHSNDIMDSIKLKLNQ